MPLTSMDSVNSVISVSISDMSTDLSVNYPPSRGRYVPPPSTEFVPNVSGSVHGNTPRDRFVDYPHSMSHESSPYVSRPVNTSDNSYINSASSPNSRVLSVYPDQSSASLNVSLNNSYPTYTNEPVMQDSFANIRTPIHIDTSSEDTFNPDIYEALSNNAAINDLLTSRPINSFAEYVCDNVRDSMSYSSQPRAALSDTNLQNDMLYPYLASVSTPSNSCGNSYRPLTSEGSYNMGSFNTPIVPYGRAITAQNPNTTPRPSTSNDFYQRSTTSRDSHMNLTPPNDLYTRLVASRDFVQRDSNARASEYQMGNSGGSFKKCQPSRDMQAGFASCSKDFNIKRRCKDSRKGFSTIKGACKRTPTSTREINVGINPHLMNMNRLTINTSTSGSFDQTNNFTRNNSQPTLGPRNIPSFCSPPKNNFEPALTPRSQNPVNIPSPRPNENAFEYQIRQVRCRGASRYDSTSSDYSSHRESDAPESMEFDAGNVTRRTSIEVPYTRSDDGFGSGGSCFNSPSSDRDDVDTLTPKSCELPKGVDREDPVEVHRKMMMDVAINKYNRERQQSRERNERKMVGKYQEIDEACLAIQDISLPVVPALGQNQDEIHNYQLPFKVANDVLESDNQFDRIDSARDPWNECVSQNASANLLWNAIQHNNSENELTPEIPFQDNLRTPTLDSETRTNWNLEELNTQLTIEPGPSYSISTENLFSQNPHQFSSFTTPVPVDCERFYRGYKTPADKSISNNSESEPVNMRPIISNSDEVSQNTRDHVETSHNAEVDERVSGLLPYWMTNESSTRTDADGQNHTRRNNTNERTTLTFTDRIRQQNYSEKMKRREYNQSKEMLRRFICDIKEENEQTESHNKLMKDTNSTVEVIYEEVKEKCESHSEKVRVNEECNWRVKSQGNMSIDKEVSGYEKTELNLKTPTDNTQEVKGECSWRIKSWDEDKMQDFQEKELPAKTGLSVESTQETKEECNWRIKPRRVNVDEKVLENLLANTKVSETTEFHLETTSDHNESTEAVQVIERQEASEDMLSETKDAQTTESVDSKKLKETEIDVKTKKKAIEEVDKTVKAKGPQKPKPKSNKGKNKGKKKR